VRLGTTVLIVPYRNAVVTAKMVSSLDALSGGRVVLGIGAGWMAEESAMLGVPFAERGPMTDEYLAAMRELWTSPAPSFAGKYTQFSGLHFAPKPVQKPYPPILMGGNGPKATDRVLDYADEWMPNRAEPEELAPRIEELRERAGRHVQVSYYAATPEDGFIERLAEAGVDRALLDVPSEPADAVLPLVERYAELAARHR
jgi:probable F420-dependent oxidoreductase